VKKSVTHKYASLIMNTSDAYRKSAPLIMFTSDAYSKIASLIMVTGDACSKYASLMWVTTNMYSQNTSEEDLIRDVHLLDASLMTIYINKKKEKPLLGSYIHHTCFIHSSNQILYTNYIQSNQILYTN
jgi:hypothetical protein